jgi:hypothetical protein
MKWVLIFIVLGLGLSCSRPAGEATAAADVEADSTHMTPAGAHSSGGLTVLRGVVRGLGPVSVYVMPKGGDSLGGSLVYPRPSDTEGLHAYEVLQVAGKQREELIWLNLGSRYDVKGELRGTLTDGGFRGEWRDAQGIPRHQVQLERTQLPYSLITRVYSKVTKPNPLSLDLHVQWTEMVDPSPPALRDAFNRTVHAEAEKGWTSFERQFEEEQRMLGNEELPEYARARTMDQYDELIYADERLICMRQFASFYMGGAHPMWGMQTKIFDVQAARFIEADELFADGRRPLAFLSTYCRPLLSKLMQAPPDDDMLLAGTAPDTANFHQLLPTAEGLLVQFNPYEVGPYAAGAPELLIPWREVQANSRLIPAVEALAGAAQRRGGKY